MDFDFSNEDRMVQEQVRRYLQDQCQLNRHRSVLDGNEAQALDVWQGLAAMGVQGTVISEDYGGVGAGYLPLCLAAKEIGAVLAPIPFSSSIYLGWHVRQRSPACFCWLQRLYAGIQEIRNFHYAIRIYENIAWLQISADHATRM